MSLHHGAVKSLAGASRCETPYSSAVTIKRGTGRQALIEATAKVLRDGREVQVSEVAAEAGVSHTLVYRHFPEGGREELIAEGYAHLFRGLARDDTAELFDILDRQGPDPEALQEYAAKLLSPRRRDARSGRLLALSQALAGELVAERVEEARQELVDEFARRLRMYDSRWTQEEAHAAALYLLAIPLGLTAIGGRDLGSAKRDEVARHMVLTLLAMLASHD